MYSYVLCSLHAVITIQIASAPFSLPTSFRKHARSPAHPQCLAEYPSRGDVSTGGVSQRWSSVAHYNACRGARTYLRIMAIMLITVSGAVRARAREQESPLRVVVTACATITGIVLPWTHAIHSLRTRERVPPSPRERGKHGGGSAGEEGGRARERKEGRTNEPGSPRSGLAQRYIPPFSPASFRLAIIRGPAKRTYQIGPLVPPVFARRRRHASRDV